MPVPAALRAPDRRRAPVEDITVVLLAHPGGPVAVQALDALAAQTHRPRRVVLTGLDPSGEEATEAHEHPLVSSGAVELHVRAALPPTGGHEPPPWRVLADAVADLPCGEGTWWWLLHDDSLPEPDALERLVAAARGSTQVGIVGPKLVRAEDPRRLLSVGIAATRGGRPGDQGLVDQIDQGQYDQRRDVLGVPLAGMLARADVLAEIGGLERAFGAGSEGLDLGWRCHLAGYRVLVAPTAVVRQGTRRAGSPSPLRTRRRFRQVALARDAWWAAPFRAVGVLVTSLLAALVLLLVKRPSDAAAELADVGAVLAPWRSWGARWRFRGRRRVRPRHLRGLFEPDTAGLTATLERVDEALTPGRRRAAASHVSAETGPVSEEAQSLEVAPSSRRWWSWPLALTLVGAAGAATLRWREHWAGLSGGGHGVTGAELLPVDAGSAAVWRSGRDAWHGAGLGGADPAAPWLLPMAGLTWLVERLPGVDPAASPAAVATAWLLFLALPLAALTAYLAAGAAVHWRPARVVVGLVWAGLPPLGAAVAEGRLGPAVAHVLAPVIVAAIAVAASRGDGARRTAAAFAGALAVGATAWFTPGVLLVSTAAGVLLLVLGPGWGRLRGLVLALLPWALLGPWLAPVAADPRLLLGGPGATAVGDGPQPWRLALLDPGGPTSPALWWTVPILLVAVLAAARPGAVGRRAAVLLAVGVLGLAAALAAGIVVLGEVPAGFGDAGRPVRAWPGTFLSFAAAGVLLAAGAALAGPGLFRGRGGSAVLRPALTVLAGVAAVAGTGLLAWSSWTGLGPSLRVAPAPVPAVVTEQATAGESLRMLALRPIGAEVSYAVHARETGPWVRDRARELSPVTAGSAGAGAEHLHGLVRALTGAPTEEEDRWAVRDRLHELAVGYVGLRAAEGAALAETLDAVPGLTRLGATPDLLLWRVGAAGPEDRLVGVGRARLLDAAGVPLAVLPVDADHGVLDHQLDDATAGATVLQLAEGTGWTEHARVRADGSRLRAEEGRWPPTYAVPAGTQRLTVDLPTADDRWLAGTVATAALTAFLALPFGSGRSRRPR